MTQFPIEDVFDKVGSIYKLVILISRRTAELNNGAPKLVEGVFGDKASAVAFEEIKEGKIKYKIKMA